MTEALVSKLDSARSTGKTVPLSENLSLAQGYDVQKSCFAEREQAIAGWKIGLTGQGIRTALGADEPGAGRLAITDILQSAVEVALGAGAYYIEAELVFEIAQTLASQDAPFTQDQVAGSVGALYAGVELVTSRFEDDDLPLGLLIADNCMADRLLIGDKVADGWNDRFAAMAMTLHGPNDAVTDGSTAAVMGNPLTAVTWLANWLGGQGMALEAGQFVSSGTCTGVTAVLPGDRVSVDLGGLGGLSIKFTARS